MADKAEMSRIGKSNVRRSKSHERRVAHLLAEWTGRMFRRRRVEGRDSTVVERESTADVIPVVGDIHFSIEAKCGEPTSLNGLLANPYNNQFTKRWHQTCYDAQLMTKVFNRHVYPLLFFKPHPSFDWIAISSLAFVNGVLLPKNGGDSPLHCWFPNFEFHYRWGEISHNISHTKNKKNHVKVPLILDNAIICRWSDFAASVNPDSFFTSPIPPIQSYVESGGDCNAMQRVQTNEGVTSGGTTITSV